MKKVNVAVVGATGMVGRKMLEVLAEEQFPIVELFLFASSRSAGKTVTYEGKDYTVLELTEQNIAAHPVEIALFSAGGSTSQTFAPVFAAHGATVVDNSSCWRMDPDVPLVVPEVNPEDVAHRPRGIIANPNCSTIQAMVALKPLDDAFGIKRVVYSTYQACSGAGLAGWQDLENGVRGEAPKKFPKRIFSNCLPHIDVFLPNGYTKEEEKMIGETRKILHNPAMRITATTVRVPVFNSHSESVNLEFERPCTLAEVRAALAAAPGLVVMDDPDNGVYPTVVEADGHNEVFVGRIRIDESVESGVNLWIVADNIRKGAAANAVQIARLLIAEN